MRDNKKICDTPNQYLIMIKQEIINAINKHLQKSNKENYQDYYIGITSNVEARLFGDHKVSRENDWWIYCPAKTEEIVREVEKYFLGVGMSGGTGGGTGDGDVRIVYCYELGLDTNP